MKCLRFSRVGQFKILTRSSRTPFPHAFVQGQGEMPSSGPFQVLICLLLVMGTKLGLHFQG